MAITKVTTDLINTLDASKLTGSMPAISGANLTSLPAGNLTGSLPAISGASLTGISSTTFAQAPVIQHQTGGGGSLTDSWPPPKRYNGLTVDITPTSASNKILVYFQQQQRVHQNGGGVAGADAFFNFLFRGNSSTTIGSVASAISGFGGTQTQIWSQEYTLWTKTTTQIDTQVLSVWYLDSPSTTNLCRYFTAVTNSGNNEHISWKIDVGTAQMYAMEIKL